MLGWQFPSSFPTPNGDYHIFTYSDKGGGGIRHVNPSETPNSTPFIHVANTQESFDKALEHGAEVMMPPTKMGEGVGIAVVKAPGGVAIGFSGPTDNML